MGGKGVIRGCSHMTSSTKRGGGANAAFPTQKSTYLLKENPDIILFVKSLSFVRAGLVSCNIYLNINFKKLFSTHSDIQMELNIFSAYAMYIKTFMQSYSKSSKLHLNITTSTKMCHRSSSLRLFENH